MDDFKEKIKISDIKTEVIDICEQLRLKIENCYETAVNLNFNIKEDRLPELKHVADGELLLEETSFNSEDPIMAESKNSDKSSNEIMELVDVHHRDCSQLSASITTTSHVCVNETQATSDLSSIHRGYPKTAAERMREYRARKKKKTPIVNYRKHRKSDAERAKEYRARKKAKIQSAAQAMDDSKEKMKISDINTEDTKIYDQLALKIEKCYETDVNIKEEICDFPELIHDGELLLEETSFNSETQAIVKEKLKISNIKTEEIYEQLSLKTENCYETGMNLDFNIKEESLHRVCELPYLKHEADGEILLEKTSFNSEYSTMAESKKSDETSNAIIVQGDVPHRACSQLSASIAITSHVCMNETQTTSDLSSIHRGYPKTAAERMREYRARKKKETPIVNYRKHRKSDAERAKEYRARKKANIQSAGKNLEFLWSF